MILKAEQLQSRERNILYILSVFFVLSLFHNLHVHPLMMEEPRRALIALEMIFRDNFIVPTEMGEYYYKKPPIYNWLLIAAYQAFGVTEFAVRFWSALSLISMGLMILEMGRQHVSLRFGWYAALLFVCSADLYLYFSWLGEIDVFYSFITLAAFFAFFHFLEKEKIFLAFFLPYGLYAIGALTKGFPSLVFMGLTTLAWLMYKRRLMLLFSWQHIVSGVAFVGILVLYFWTYSQYNDLENYFLAMWSQSSERTPIEYDIVAVLRKLVSFPLLIAKDIMPATLLLPFVFHKRSRQNLFKNPFVAFCLVIWLANIWIYWISPGTRSRYLYMLHPPLISVLVYAFLLTKSEFDVYRRVLRVVIYLLGAVCVIALGYIVIIQPLSLPLSSFVVLVILMVVSIGLFIYFITFPKTQKMVVLLAFMVVARFAVNSIILPQRATDSVWAHYKESALRIADRTKGKPLYVLSGVTYDNMVLEVVFYLERARGQVLTVAKDVKPGKYYIIDAEVLPKEDITPIDRFEKEGRTYYLVQF